MRKQLIATCFAIGCSFMINNSLKAENIEENQPLADGMNVVAAENPQGDPQIVGRWELCGKDGKPTGKPNVRQKIYTRNSYVVVEVDKPQNNTYMDFIGKIDYEGGDKMVETPIYTDPRIKYMQDKGFRFSYKVEGQCLYLKGLNNTYDEVWIRVSE